MTFAKENFIPCPACSQEAASNIYTIESSRPIIVGVCQNCGTIYQTNPMGDAELEEHYRDFSRYHGDGAGSRRQRMMALRFARFGGLFDEIQNQFENPVVLDVGCGFGDFLNGFDGAVWRRLGVEFNPERAAHGREHFDLDIKECRLEEAGLEPGSVHLVTGFGLFEHLTDPHGFLRAVREVLHPQGRLLLNAPDTGAPLVALSQFFSLDHTLYFSAATLKAVLEAAGFEVMIEGCLTPDYPDVVSISRLADCSKTGASCMKANPQEAQRLMGVIEEYRIQRKGMIDGIRARLEAAGLLSEPESCAIYGTGDHTTELLREYPELRSVRCYIDSDPKKWSLQYENGVIHAPSDLGNLDVSAVIISSKAFESEIAEKVASMGMRQDQIVRLYTSPEAAS